jgi:hypothetical protein
MELFCDIYGDHFKFMYKAMTILLSNSKDSNYCDVKRMMIPTV